MSQDAIDRAKKAKEEIENRKKNISVPENDFKIEELDEALNNVHKPFEPEIVEEKIGEVEGEAKEWSESPTIEEELAPDPDKEIPNVGTPLSEQPKKRSYAGANNEPVNPLEQEPIIPEPTITSAIGGNPLNPVEPNNSDTKQETVDPKPKPQPINPDYGDMSPTEKRKNAEKTADVILLNYAEILPLLPKLLVKWDMEKMTLLEIKKEIRLSMQINEEGLTVRDWMSDVNDTADKVYVITDDMKEAIRPSLIDVLMEKGMTMTPMQRLLSAVGTQVLAFGVASFKMAMDNRNALKTFKEYKARENRGDKGEGGNGGNTQQPVQPTNNPVQPSQQQNNNKKEADVVSTEVAKITMSDVLSVANGGIEIIEEPNN